MPEWLLNSYVILTGGPGASPADRILHLALIGCSLFAGGQMLTMLSTRWGEHHAMLKSFILSLLIHLCLGLGWASVADNVPPPASPGEGEGERFTVQQVLSSGDDSLPQATAGNTPVWQQPLSLPTPLLARRDASAPTAPQEAPLPERESVATPAPPPEIPALSTAATTPETTPEIARAPEAVAPAPAAPTADAPPSVEAIARAETGPVTAASARQSMNRSPTFDAAPMSAPARGSALRTAPNLDDLALSAPLPIDEAPTLARPAGLTSNEIARQASPVATPGDDPQAGATSAASAGVDSPRFSRSSNSRTRPVDAAPGARSEPFRSNVDAAHDRVASASRSLTNTIDSDPRPTVIRPTTNEAGGLALPPAAATYQLRSVDRRQEAALKNGGTESSERAVEEALRWLARHQESAGFWDADKHGGGQREVRPIEKGRPSGGDETDTGVTGLAILSFLGAGYTHEEGDYAEVVSQAIRWLIEQQRSDGYLGGKATYYDQMYCHGIATYALAEAYGMQSDPAQFPQLREAVAQGVWYITQSQNTDGGWRYRVGASASDMSMFGWQLMALKSAELAGLQVPEETRSGMIKFLRDRSRGDRLGLAGYKDTDPPSPSMTAEALFCKQMYGLKRSAASSREAADYLQTNLPKLSNPDEYYWYYGTLAMFQYGGEPWQRWNQSLRDTLIRLQRKNGDNTGSWDPAGPWGSVGGRVYSTTLCVLSLEVYYRFLPLYRVAEE